MTHRSSATGLVWTLGASLLAAGCTADIGPSAATGQAVATSNIATGSVPTGGAPETEIFPYGENRVEGFKILETASLSVKPATVRANVWTRATEFCARRQGTPLEQKFEQSKSELAPNPQIPPMFWSQTRQYELKFTCLDQAPASGTG